MNPFTKLLQSRRFWLAVLALLEVVLYLLKPDFPAVVWGAVSNVLLVLIVSITVENSAQYIAAGISPSARLLAANLESPSRLPWLLRSRKFWLAVLAVVQTVVFTVWVDVPVELWESINALLLVLIGLFAVEDAVKSISYAVAFRKD